MLREINEQTSIQNKGNKEKWTNKRKLLFDISIDFHSNENFLFKKKIKINIMMKMKIIVVEKWKKWYKEK